MCIKKFISACVLFTILIAAVIIPGGNGAVLAANGSIDEALITAVEGKNYKAVKTALEKGADPNTLTSTGESVLMIVSKKGSHKMVNLLLKKGADPNFQVGGMTSLMVASTFGNLKTVNYLLKYKADVNKRALGDGRTALHTAASRKHLNYKILEALLKAKADPNIQDDEGKTPLIYVVNKKETGKDWVFREIGKSVKVLLKYKANPDLKDSNGQNALMYATISNWPSLVTYMLKAGADPNIVNSEGNSTLDIANTWGRDKIVTSLLKYGAK